MLKDILVAVLVGIVMAIIGGNAVTAYICGLLTLIGIYVITIRLELLKVTVFVKDTMEFIEDIKKTNKEYVTNMQAVESVEGEVVDEYGTGTED